MKVTFAFVAVAALLSASSIVEAKNLRSKAAKRTVNIWQIDVDNAQDSASKSIFHGDTVYQMVESSNDDERNTFDQLAKELYGRRKLSSRKQNRSRKLTKASGGGEWFFDARASSVEFKNGKVEGYTPDDDGVCGENKCTDNVSAFVDTGDSSTLDIVVVEAAARETTFLGQFACPNALDVVKLEHLFSCGIFDENRKQVADCTIEISASNNIPFFVVSAVSTVSDLELMTVAEFILECGRP